MAIHPSVRTFRKAKKEKTLSGQKPKVSPSAASSANPSGRIAAIRIRGCVQVPIPIKDTLSKLHLFQNNICAVYPDTPAIRGMLIKIKDHITWGLLSTEGYQLLASKRGVKDPSTSDMKNYFHLHPPRGGYERRGIKRAYGEGGALGYRGDAINKLIQKMI